MEEAAYWLSPLVYACRTRQGTVLLDALANQYFSVNREHSRELAKVVRGWPRGADSSSTNPASSANVEVVAVVEELLLAGLLNRERAVHGEIVPLEVCVDGSVSSVGDEIVSDCRVKVHHVVSFCAAYAWSLLSLRCRPFYKILMHISHTKPLFAHREIDISRTADLVSIFRRVRPYVFSVKGRCLLHALTLTKFLAHYGVPATWVIGVSSVPWSAHSWVQQGGYILDSNPEKVCHFTPILAV